MRFGNFAAILSVLLHASFVISLPQGFVPGTTPTQIDLLLQLQKVNQAAMSGDPVLVYNLVAGLFQSELQLSLGQGTTTDPATTSYYIEMMRQFLAQIHYHTYDLALIQNQCAQAINLIQQTGYSYYVVYTYESTVTTTTTVATGA